MSESEPSPKDPTPPSPGAQSTPIPPAAPNPEPESTDQEVTQVIGDCPECEAPIDVTEISPYSKIECPHCSEAIRVKSQLGNYRITGLLGEGGMSQVFNATDMTLNRQVALKILHQTLSKDDGLTAMFEREARLTASITHPNVVKVYTASRDQGYFYIAMELVDNVSVEQIIATQGALREARVLDLAHDVTNGLKAAYNEGLIHRDIKPGNMLVTTEGVGKLVDFGLAMIHDGEDEVADMWATPFYVPPEKLDGQPDTFLGDIYSLGATFFHALAGKPPFEANTSSLEELKAIKAKPVSLREVAPTVSKQTVAMVEKLMAYRPEDRPQSYQEVLDLIEATLETVPGTTKKRSGRNVKSNGGGMSKKSWIAIGAGLAAIVAAIFGIMSFVVGGDNNSDPSLIGSEGQVIGGESISAKYNAGREALIAGKFGKANTAFEELLASGELEQPTRGWVQFNQGMAQLLSGNEFEARSHFEKLKAIKDFAAEGNSVMITQQGFFKRIGEIGVAHFPILETETATLSTDHSIDSLGLLVSGLKNWNQGEFKSGAELLQKFESSSAPTGYEWIEGLKIQIAPFLADAKVINSLPKPVGGLTNGEVSSIKRELTTASETLQTRAAKKFVQSRLERCDEVVIFKANSLKLAKIANAPVVWPEKQRIAPAGDMPTETPKTKKPPKVSDAPKYDPADFSSQETTEYETLSKAFTGATALSKNYLFGAAALKVGTAQIQTPRISQLHEDSVRLYNHSEKFIERFVTEMASGLEESSIRRKIGKPIQAKITAATSDELTVDLGFGPTPVPLEKFDPDWIREVSETKFLQPSIHSPASDPALWESAASFVLISGHPEHADRIATQVRSVSAEFNELWSRLTEAQLLGLGNLTPEDEASEN